MVSRGVAGMPLPGKPGVVLNGPAHTETARPTGTVGADCVASIPCQMSNSGLPLMVPAASMFASCAPQPDLPAALLGEVSWQLAQIEGGVPHALNNLVIRVCQRLLALLVEAYPSDT
jgi:hypothetical protein